MTDAQALALVPPVLSVVIALFSPALGKFTYAYELKHWTAVREALPETPSDPSITLPSEFEPEEIAARSGFVVDASQCLFAVLLPAFGAAALRDEGGFLPLTLVATAAIAAVVLVAVVFAFPDRASAWSWPKHGRWRYSVVGVVSFTANAVALGLIAAWG